MEWKFTRNLASEKLNSPFSASLSSTHFLDSSLSLTTLRHSSTKKIKTLGRRERRGEGIVHLGTVSLLLILLLETIREKKKRWPPPSEQRGREPIDRLISRWNWVEIDFHSNHSDYIWPMNESGGRGEQTKENKRLLRHLREPTWGTNLSHDFN